MRNPERTISVTVVFALEERYYAKTFAVPHDATVAEVMAGYVADEGTPRWALPTGPVGIFGHVVQGGDRLKEGDRIECYRPLRADPKSARRHRANARSVKTVTGS